MLPEESERQARSFDVGVGDVPCVDVSMGVAPEGYNLGVFSTVGGPLDNGPVLTADRPEGGI